MSILSSLAATAGIFLVCFALAGLFMRHRITYRWQINSRLPTLRLRPRLTEAELERARIAQRRRP